MINVSDKYIEAIHSTSRETDLRCQIVLNDGGVMNVTSRDLLPGSTHYSNKCLNNNTYNLGSCYIGEFKTTIKTSVDRYKLRGGIITVEFLMKVDEGEWEVVSVGRFTIESAQRVGKYVEIDAYDNMSLLETNISAGTSGLPSELLTWICQQCKVDNGMTSDMWDTLVNTTYVYAFSESDYSTYRDLLSDIATLTGGFATIDSYGALVIKPFIGTIVDTVDDRIRSSSKFEDYVCKYTAATIRVKGVQYGYAAETNDGLAITLNDNKLAGANSTEQINEMLFNIVERIKTIEYIPCEVTMMVNPAYELGDCIAFTGYNTGTTQIVSQIHSIDWTFRNSMSIISIGENSKIANAKSTSEKAVDGADYSAVELKTMQFTNARKITFEGGPNKRVTILDANFSATANETAIPLLSGQFVANIEKPGIYRLIYDLNGVQMDFKPEEAIYTTGNKIFTFIKAFTDLSVDTSNRLRIYMECDPLTIITKELTEDTTTGKYSLTDVETTYNGKITIEVGNVQAVMQGANLSFAIKWDGNFEILEEFTQPMQFQKYTMIPPVGKTSVTLTESTKMSISERTRCAYNPVTFIAPLVDMQLIFDYDAVPIYDLPYKQILNNASDTGTLSNSSVIIIPETDRAGCCAPYYMQLANGERTRITLTTDANAQIYLLNELTENLYNVAIVGDNGVIEYTSTGARFWLLVISNSRHDNGTYTITTQSI